MQALHHVHQLLGRSWFGQGGVAHVIINFQVLVLAPLWHTEAWKMRPVVEWRRDRRLFECAYQVYQVAIRRVGRQLKYLYCTDMFGTLCCFREKEHQVQWRDHFITHDEAPELSLLR
jgi:hypothetical protein